MGFPEVEVEATLLLALTPARLKTLTATQCGEAAFTLEQFSYHLQRCINRERTRVAFADENIRRLIAKFRPAGYSWDERRAAGVACSEMAAQFDALRVHAQNRVNRIDFVSGKIDAMVKTLLALQQTKRGKYD